MGPYSLLRLIAIFAAISPSVVAAGGGGRVEDAIELIDMVFGNPAPSAIAIIFVCANLVQLIFALRNICVRLMGHSPFTKEPEFSLGPMFPIFILLSPSLLSAYYILQTIFLTSLDDDSVPSRDLSQAFFDAKDAVRVLGDVSLVSALLSLISHREKVLFESPGRWRPTKIIIDVLLVLALLGLGMGSSWLLKDGDPGSKIIEREKLVWTYTSLFLVAVVDIMVSSFVLRNSIKQGLIDGRTIVNDHKMIRRIVINISLPFVFYAIFLVIKSVFSRSRKYEGWELADLILGGIIEFWIIFVCLFFGFPMPKKIAKALGWGSED